MAAKQSFPQARNTAAPSVLSKPKKIASKGPRIGTRLRGKLTDAYGARGHHLSNLWYAYSPKSKVDVVLHSDVEFGHFLLVESDLDIVEVDYAPQKRIALLGGEALGTIVDAELTRRSGARVWREVKRSEDIEQGAQNRANLQLLIQMKAADFDGATHELFTEKQVFSQPQRIHNWFRIIAWLSQCRTYPLDNYTRAVLKIIRTRREVQLADVAALGPDTEIGLYCAAIFKALQQGLVLSDLDVVPLTWDSRFYLAGDA
ncbi:hypothetical protein [Acidovorax sp. NCPPB 3576]|uniref:hypothetical protein n=1 Tax=Acidovorax sp. NCPPB 3576 TaxID=2940488 RepID=UPI002349A1AC|nr:hypothetical protein [Acidovorax sp. NCPPB 3576]WCM90619.1 hypothetical protein M5C98_11635 [Acidovorax sp. NCPPB 3576]